MYKPQFDLTFTGVPFLGCRLLTALAIKKHVSEIVDSFETARDWATKAVAIDIPPWTHIVDRKCMAFVTLENIDGHEAFAEHTNGHTYLLECKLTIRLSIKERCQIENKRPVWRASRDGDITIEAHTASYCRHCADAARLRSQMATSSSFITLNSSGEITELSTSIGRMIDESERNRKLEIDALKEAIVAKERLLEINETDRQEALNELKHKDADIADLKLVIKEKNEAIERIRIECETLALEGKNKDIKID